MTAFARPTFHFSPPQNWLNDPNGLTYLDGEYHLYYQHNPYGTGWGHMSWGHAVSREMLRWEHLPIALMERPAEGYTIFSGSAVIDHANTSGFGAPDTPALVAVFTADYRDGRALETIHVAYSLDGGRTFTDYPGNPVLDVGDPKFGDPKVFWHAESGQWVLAAIKGYGQGCLQLYGSPNLREWTLLSEFHAPAAAPGIWECPDLFPLPVEGSDETIWAVKVNCVVPKEQGGGQTTRYFLGRFTGRDFDNLTPDGVVSNADADDLYAEMTWNDLPDGRRVLLGWVRQPPHADRPWTGMLSLPRTLAARHTPAGWQVVQRPIAEVEGPRQEPLPLEGAAFTLPGGPREVAVTTPGDCRFTLRLADGSEITTGCAEGELFAVVPGRPRISIPARPAGEESLRLFVDHNLLELFAETSGVNLTAVWESPAVCAEIGMTAKTAARGMSWRLGRS